MKNNFNEYGFEADFEGEICFENHNGFYIGYINKPIGKLFNQWRKGDGNCFCMEGYYDRQYDLNLIKKEWYENPNNFPCVMYSNLTHSFFIVDRIEDFILDKKYRLATKEEVLSLLVEEN